MIERRNPFQDYSSKGLRRVGSAPLEVIYTRGQTIESVHRVHAVVKNSAGKTTHSWGNPQLPVFPRSAVKLMQALPFVLKGSHEKWKLRAEELALTCSSHKGEKIHAEKVQSWLAKMGLSDKDLECGTHPPGSEDAHYRIVKEGGKFCPLHNNCSGKHAGMLMGCLDLGLPIKGYSNFDHPYQARIREIMCKFFDLDMEQIPWGIDGCGVPTYAFPLETLALGMARSADSAQLGSKIQSGVELLLGAISSAPDYFGGTESFSSQVVKETGGKVFAKEGAEGIYTAWIPEAKIGFALKVEDGAKRASEVAAVRLLRELGYALPMEAQMRAVGRWGGEIVGEAYCT